MKKINLIMGTNVRELRKWLTEYTQHDIADMLGVSRANWVNIENGRQTIMPQLLYTFCSIVKCHPNDIYPPIIYIRQPPSKKVVKKKVVVIRTYRKKLKLKKVKSSLK